MNEELVELLDALREVLREGLSLHSEYARTSWRDYDAVSAFFYDKDGGNPHNTNITRRIVGPQRLHAMKLMDRIDKAREKVLHDSYHSIIDCDCFDRHVEDGEVYE